MLPAPAESISSSVRRSEAQTTQAAKPEGGGRNTVNQERIEHWIAIGRQALGDRDWDAYGALFSEALLMRAPGLAGITTGREARVTMVKGIIDAFPDGRAELERSFGEGDRACFQFQFSGIHTGPLATPEGGQIAPTNKPVRFPYCLIVRFGQNGQAVEVDEYFDRLDMLSQIGVAP